MTIPANVTLTGRRNAAFDVRIRFKDAGVPMDFTGWSARLQVRKVPGSVDTPEVEIRTGFSTVPGSTIEFQGDGWVRFYIAKPDMAAFPAVSGLNKNLMDQYFYDALFTSPSNVPDVYMAGPFNLFERVTYVP